MFLFRSATTREANLAMLIVRVVAGLTMAAHGWQKVFQYGMGTVAGNFASMGIPAASVAGPFISLLELVGGIALALGLLTRVFSALLAVNMLFAAYFVHLPSGFFAPKGVEMPLLLMAMYAALALVGGGSMSLDAMFRRGHSLSPR